MKILILAAMLFPAGLLAAVARPASGDAAYRKIEAAYMKGFLARYPVVSTYLGGSGLDRSLARTDGTLRDWSPEGLQRDGQFFRGIREELSKLDSKTLSPRHRIDREVVLHQIAFVLHENEERKYWQRSLDTYVNEAFRGVDWYMQGMKDLGRDRYGTEAEWKTVASRVAAIPKYLATAKRNLEAGIAAGNTPDWRMVERDGLATAEENARYFEKTLADAAERRTRGETFSAAIVAALRKDGQAAAAAFRGFHDFIARSLATLPKTDRFAFGGKEYDWALRNNLDVDATAAELFDKSQAVVDEARARLIEAAKKVAEKHHLDLPWDAGHRESSTRAVYDFLAKDYPKSDEEMTGWYHRVCLRLVAFARRNDMFDIPQDYRLEVTVTPPVLESSIEGAAYYPAPPFLNSGVGRFYVTPTHGNIEKLKQANRASLADLAAHEGFPGHDWHYKVMTKYRKEISPVRWLTPGEVEGSSSMWEDSMAAEGWAHYAEALMAEPEAKDPEGFYTPEELVYEIQGELLRDLRVRIDTGLHTGKISYDGAVDLFSQTIDFLPGSCRDANLSPEKKASCEAADRAIFRYSKWPTQAITYRLGKERILALRDKAQKIVPGKAGEKRFHLLFMKEGTIPPDYFGTECVREMGRK
jgi:uncharacterized protein (DUF885 family)